MWGKIIIPMYRLWLYSLYGLYGPRCPLSPKRPINLISLNTWLQWIGHRQLQDETKNIYVWGLGAAYIRDLTVLQWKSWYFNLVLTEMYFANKGRLVSVTTKKYLFFYLSPDPFPSLPVQKLSLLSNDNAYGLNWPSSLCSLRIWWVSDEFWSIKLRG